MSRRVRNSIKNLTIDLRASDVRNVYKVLYSVGSCLHLQCWDGYKIITVVIMRTSESCYRCISFGSNSKKRIQQYRSFRSIPEVLTYLQELHLRLTSFSPLV